jgi:4-aminobutyrate aminotransferase-like enzyme
MSLYDCGHAQQDINLDTCEICSPIFSLKGDSMELDNIDQIDNYVLTLLNQLEMKVDAMPEAITGLVKELLIELDKQKAEERKEKVMKLMDYLKKSGLLTIGAATLEMIRFLFSLF